MLGLILLSIRLGCEMPHHICGGAMYLGIGAAELFLTVRRRL
jgi:hypothetical protein